MISGGQLNSESGGQKINIASIAVLTIIMFFTVRKHLRVFL